MSLLLLAFEAALYPTLLAAVVILLSLERPARLIAAYLAGGMTISIALGVLIVELLGGTNAVQSQQSLLSWTGDLVIGGLAVLLAVALATHADDRLRERRRGRRGTRWRACERARRRVRPTRTRRVRASRRDPPGTSRAPSRGRSGSSRAGRCRSCSSRRCS
jgi:Sap, sulfolipid-1-addressing protein